MRRVCLILAASILLSTTALAAGTHGGGHDELPIGKPGDKKKVTRTIEIIMKEDGKGKMLFSPAKLTFKEGQTVKLRFVNQGEMDHEFVMDEETTILEHEAFMAKNPDMEHDDPNAIRLAPGARGEIIWTFSKAGIFTFACLVPGHYEAGMHGPLEVDSAVANNP
jgi:uncharacterized cupredoxin-like copper-binding protein